MDKSFSEQQIRIVDANYILCEKNWTRTRSGTGSYGRQEGGRQAGGRGRGKSETGTGTGMGISRVKAGWGLGFLG